jgi:hypothetical protein
VVISFARVRVCILIILNFLHYKIIIMNKFNLKNYWREILIGILIALLLWISSADRPVQTIGHTDTICVADTITKPVPGATLVKYVKVKLPVHIYDTITHHQILNEYKTIMDTSWLYTDVPMNEYKDTSYYVRTIGWLDSISIYRPQYQMITGDKMTSSPFTIFGNTQLGNGVVAPGVSLSVRKLQLGYNYNVLNQSGVVTVGYRIR